MSSIKSILYKSENSVLQTEKIRFVLALLFVFSLPYNRFYSSVVLIVLMATTLIDLKVSKFKTIPKQVWLFQLIFFLACIGYSYSFNKAEAGFILERQLAIVLFPIILPLAITFNERRKNMLLGALSISCLLAIMYLFASALYVLSIGHLPLQYIFSKDFFNHQFSAPIGIHAGYLSLYVSISLLFMLQLFIQHKSFIKKGLLMLGGLILIAGMFFLASRNNIISTILIVSIIFPLFFVKRKILFFSTIAVLLIGCFLILNKVNYLSDRFSSELIGDIKSNADGHFSEGAEPRVERWKGALELIAKSPILGYGTGDEISMLKVKYVEKELFISYIESFNAHNQYLSYLIKNGIIGIVIFLSAFVYYLRLAIKKRDFMYVSFLIILLIGFFTENILDANKGIFFFAFFNTYFGYNILFSNKKEPLTQH